MTGIAVFEENVGIAEEMREYMEGYLVDMRITFYVDIFISRGDLLQEIIETGNYSAIFLGIGSRNQSGISMAENIRKYAKDSLMVLVCNSAEYAIEGYKLGALRYLLKYNSSFESDLDECMGAIMDKLQIDSGYREFDFLEGRKRVRLHNVVYIESDLHKLVFYIWENGIKAYTEYGGINEVTKDLSPYGFIRVHKSFTINIFYLMHLDKYQVFLRRGIVLPVSKYRYKDVKEKYLEYRSRKMS